MSTDTMHPHDLAREEAKRGDSNERARMRDAIAHTFGIRIDDRRLEVDESRQLLELHKKAVRHEGWEASGRHYGLASRLDRHEQQRWRALVGKAAGVDLDALDEDGRIAAKISELVRRAAAPAPSSMAAPIGSGVLPASVLEDVYAGRLFGLDVAVLAVVVLAFAGSRLHPAVERYAAWTDEGRTLLLRGGLHRLLLQWDRPDEFGMDAVSLNREAIAKRLAVAGWLVVETAGNETRVRFGPRILASFEHAEADVS